jgi:hypothetical protein
MRLKIFLTLFAILSLSACKRGPQVSTGVFDPTLNQFEESDSKGNVIAPVPFSAANGYIAFPPLDFQALFNYCETRSQSGIIPPATITKCTVSSTTGVFNCTQENCTGVYLGLNCSTVSGIVLKPSDAANYVGFNPSDLLTYTNFCNYKL